MCMHSTRYIFAGNEVSWTFSFSARSRRRLACAPWKQQYAGEFIFVHHVIFGIVFKRFKNTLCLISTKQQWSPTTTTCFRCIWLISLLQRLAERVCVRAGDDCCSQKLGWSIEEAGYFLEDAIVGEIHFHNQVSPGFSCIRMKWDQSLCYFRTLWRRRCTVSTFSERTSWRRLPKHVSQVTSAAIRVKYYLNQLMNYTSASISNAIFDKCTKVLVLYSWFFLFFGDFEILVSWICISITFAWYLGDKFVL
jgi:hypothetical protein